MHGRSLPLTESRFETLKGLLPPGCMAPDFTFAQFETYFRAACVASEHGRTFPFTATNVVLLSGEPLELEIKCATDLAVSHVKEQCAKKLASAELLLKLVDQDHAEDEVEPVVLDPAARYWVLDGKSKPFEPNEWHGFTDDDLEISAGLRKFHRSSDKSSRVDDFESWKRSGMSARERETLRKLLAKNVRAKEFARALTSENAPKKDFVRSLMRRESHFRLLELVIEFSADFDLFTQPAAGAAGERGPPRRTSRFLDKALSKIRSPGSRSALRGKYSYLIYRFFQQAQRFPDLMQTLFPELNGEEPPVPLTLESPRRSEKSFLVSLFACLDVDSQPQARVWATWSVIFNNINFNVIFRDPAIATAHILENYVNVPPERGRSLVDVLAITLRFPCPSTDMFSFRASGGWCRSITSPHPLLWIATNPGTTLDALSAPAPSLLNILDKRIELCESEVDDFDGEYSGESDRLDDEESSSSFAEKEWQWGIKGEAARHCLGELRRLRGELDTAISTRRRDDEGSTRRRDEVEGDGRNHAAIRGR